MIGTMIQERAMALNIAADGKDAVLHRAAELLADGFPGDGPPRDTVYRLLADREKLGSTGIGGGIAIPHATTDDLDDFRMALLTLPGGVDFGSLDGRPVMVVFAMIGPESRRSDHVRILAALSRLVKQEGFTESLAGASDPQDAIRLVRTTEEPDAPASATVAKSLLWAVVQNESYLEPLLEVLTGISDSEVVVVEGHGPGRYLHALPLFAMFWADESRKTESKVIIAVIDRHVGNETIRRISSDVVDPSRDSGLMVAIQDLSLVTGSLDI